MILVKEERTERLINIGTLQRQIRGIIKNYRKKLDDEGCFPDTQTEILDFIAICQSDLQYLTEMQKIPFDVLVVIEK